MKNPTLLIMLPVSTNNEWADGPDVVLVDLTILDCKRLLARQAVAKEMKSDDLPLTSMSFYFPVRYYRSEKAPIFSQEQIDELGQFNRKKSYLCKVVDADDLKERDARATSSERMTKSVWSAAPSDLMSRPTGSRPTRSTATISSRRSGWMLGLSRPS